MPVINFTPKDRTCPKCNGIETYYTYIIWWRAVKENRMCRKCAGEHRKNTHFSRGHSGLCNSPESKKRLSEAGKRRYSLKSERQKASEIAKVAMHRPDVRKRHLKALAESKFFGKPTDVGQIALLEKWNRLGFRFEPNYQLHTDYHLFYLDGYDKEKNVVLEFDSKYHLKPKQKLKDEFRQKIIIDVLQPKKFWRYDSVNKKIRNVVERNS